MNLFYQKDKPDIIISIREGTNKALYPALLAGELDLIVGRLAVYRGRHGVEQKELYHESVRIVCSVSYPLAQDKSVALKDLADCNWILPPPETTLRRELDRVFGDNGMPTPKRRYESVALLTNIALFAEGNFIGALPEHVYLVYRSMFKLTALPIAIEPIGYSLRQGETPPPSSRTLSHTFKEQQTVREAHDTHSPLQRDKRFGTLRSRNPRLHRHPNVARN